MKNTCSNSVLIIVVLGSLWVLSCDAPRHNPLDPKNPNNVLCSISGQVSTITTPSQPIQGVAVRWKNDDRLTYTNTNGYFALNGLAPQSGFLQFYHESFFADSLEIAWDEDKQIKVQVSLNAKPVLEGIKVFSVLLNRYPDLKTTQVVINADVSDPDNDIDSVYAINAHLHAKTYLHYNLDDRAYEKTLTPYSLNIASIEMAVGHEFEIYVVDRFTRTVAIGSGSLLRVIQDEVRFDSPASFEQVSSTPQLLWQPFDPGFDFEFMVEIYTAEIDPQKVWGKSAIPSAATDVTVDKELPPGDYFWVVWCIDEFLNRSRSKPASFTVQ